MTSEQITEYELEILVEALDDDGTTSMSDGVRSRSRDPDLYKRKLSILDALRMRQTPSSGLGIRFCKLIPPGGGG